jgi:hypothetical protein
MTLVAHTVPTKKLWFVCSARSFSRVALAMTFGLAQFGANDSSQAKPDKGLLGTGPILSAPLRNKKVSNCRAATQSFFACA